ncbi:hypothetical protein B0H10DRAFT_2218730 [Mycena sp. CBHHK59/15]|nr:hypothetical protein B0H10DRAFT_2218730 [Mycena sp. CBHHK59/15]
MNSAPVPSSNLRQDFPHLIKPLPYGFPLFFLPETFHGTDDDGALLEYLVTLTCGGRTHVASASWLVVSGDFLLGVFEIPAPIYDDPLRSFPIGPDIVLDGLINSISHHDPVRLSSGFPYHPVTNSPGPALYAVDVLLGGHPPLSPPLPSILLALSSPHLPSAPRRTQYPQRGAGGGAPAASTRRHSTTCARYPSLIWTSAAERLASAIVWPSLLPCVLPPSPPPTQHPHYAPATTSLPDLHRGLPHLRAFTHAAGRALDVREGEGAGDACHFAAGIGAGVCVSGGRDLLDSPGWRVPR